MNMVCVASRDNDKRAAALSKAKLHHGEKEDGGGGALVVAATKEDGSPSPRLDKENKKKDAEVHIIASLPKPQSLPAHQLFKDKRKVYQVTCAVTRPLVVAESLLLRFTPHTLCFLENHHGAV